MANAVGAVSNNPASPFYNANAPNLTGQVGQLLTVLDACLVNGFTGFTALGWSKPFANSGNLGCYKNSTSGSPVGTGYCLAVNDNGPGAGGAKEARVCGFTSMASVSTGSGQWPTSGQSTIGTGQLVVRKSAAASSSTVYYTLVGDCTCFYMFVETGDVTSPLGAYMWMFGDFLSYCPTDTNNCVIRARTIENTSACYNNSTSSIAGLYDTAGILIPPGTSNFLSTTLNGIFVASSFTGVGGSLPVGVHTDQTKQGSIAGVAGTIYWNFVGATGGAGNFGPSVFPNNFALPNPSDGGVYTAPMWIHHNNGVRGIFKGLWCPLQNLPLNHNDTYSVASANSNINGRSLLAQALATAYNGSSGTPAMSAQIHVETTSTGWV